MSNGVPPSELLPAYQNPTYPEDANLTLDQIAAKMRERSLVRAQSPAEHICMMDGVSDWLNPKHTHGYDEFMAYRRSHIDADGHIIADGEPWINWESFDIWADKAPPPDFPPGLAQPPLTGWQKIFSVRPGGISYPTDYLATGWGALSIAVEIDRKDLLRYDLGVAIRVRFLVWGLCNTMFVGPRSITPMKPTTLVPLTFKGQNQISTAVADGGTGYPMEFLSDPIVAIDYRAGLHIAFSNSNAYLGLSGPPHVPGWNTNYIPWSWWGYQAPTYQPNSMDKTNWYKYPGYAVGPYLVEALFPAHPEAIAMPVWPSYSLGAPDFGTAPPPSILS